MNSLIPVLLTAYMADNGEVVYDKHSLRLVEGDPYDPDDLTTTVEFGANDDDDDDDLSEEELAELAQLEGDLEGETGAPLTREERKLLRRVQRRNREHEKALHKKDQRELRELRHNLHKPGNQAGHPHHPEAPMKHSTSWLDSLTVTCSTAGEVKIGEFRIDYDEVDIEDITISSGDTTAKLMDMKINKHHFIESNDGVGIDNFGVALLNRPKIQTRKARQGETLYVTFKAGSSPGDIVITFRGKKYEHRNC